MASCPSPAPRAPRRRGSRPRWTGPGVRWTRRWRSSPSSARSSRSGSSWAPRTATWTPPLRGRSPRIRPSASATKPGTKIRKAPALFPRIEVSAMTAASPERQDKRISIEEFGRLDLRVAELVAGIAEHYAPADLVGKKVVVVANLEPATLMGVESNGMVLAASEGKDLALIVLDRDLPS